MGEIHSQIETFYWIGNVKCIKILVLKISIENTRERPEVEMKVAAGLLCGLAALRQFKQTICLLLLTDHTHARMHTHSSCGMLTVFISVQALGNKAW